MSLQHAAKHLEKHGRNGDTVLVHMSKGEVKSLNDLAMANGGYLTINPHTGLPEAGFLQRMLPMVIGAGLVASGVGSPLGAAMLVGGGYYASTGSLKQGLMAGLGAYGGAGMASSFGAAGASSVVPPAGDLATLTPAAPAPVAPMDASNYVRPPEFITPPINPSPTVVDAAGNVSQAAMSQPIPQNVVTTGSPMGGIGHSPQAFASNPAGTNLSPVSASAPAVNPNLAVNPLSGRPLPAPVVSAPAPVADVTAPVESTARFPGDEISAKYPTQAPSMDFKNMTASQRLEAIKSGASFDNLGDWASKNTTQAYGMGASAIMPWDEEKEEERKPYRDSDPGQQYTYEANATSPTPMSDPYGREQKYFNQRYVKRAANGGMMASGGITGQGGLQLNIPLDLGGGSGGGSYGGGGNGGGTYPFQSSGGFTGNNNAPQDVPQEVIDQYNAARSGQPYRTPQVTSNPSLVADQAQRMQPYQTSPTPGLGAPQGNLFSGTVAEPQDKSNLFEFQQNANPMQQGTSQIAGLGSVMRMAVGGMASGGISDAGYNLGGYSDGGRLLRGPGDGVSDSIPAVIGKRQPARLADGEFVIPARIVSELGNGSTEAGARKLYAMMDRIQKTRGKTVGKGKVAKNSRADKHLPA